MDVSFQCDERIEETFEEEKAYSVIHEDFWNLYEKKRKLGEGTTGTVYKCKEIATGRKVAVKCVRTRDEELIFMVLTLFRSSDLESFVDWE